MNKERIASLEERETKNDKVRDHRLQQDIVLVTAGSNGAFKLEGRIVRRRGTSQGISEPRHSFVCFFFWQVGYLDQIPSLSKRLLGFLFTENRDVSRRR